MDEQTFDELVLRFRLSFWLPTMTDLLSLRRDREDSIIRVDWIPGPPEGDEKPRQPPSARQGDYNKRLDVRPDDVLAYVISCLEPHLRRHAVGILLRHVRKTDDPRRRTWMSALQTLAHHVAAGKEPLDSRLVAVLSEELPKSPTEEDESSTGQGPGKVDFERRLSSVGMLVLVSNLGLKPTRARNRGDAPNAAGGSASDVVAAAIRVGYTTVEDTWTQALRAGWLTRDAKGVVCLPEDSEVAACTVALPPRFGLPDMYDCIMAGRDPDDADLLEPFHADDATSALPKRTTISAFRDYAPKELFVHLTWAPKLSSRRSAGSWIRDLITR